MSHMEGEATAPLAARLMTPMWLNHLKLVSDKIGLRLPKEKGDTARLPLPQAIWSLILFSCSELSYLVMFLAGAGQLHEGRTPVLCCFSRAFLCRLLCLVCIFYFLFELPLYGLRRRHCPACFFPGNLKSPDPPALQVPSTLS